MNVVKLNEVYADKHGGFQGTLRHIYYHLDPQYGEIRETEDGVYQIITGGWQKNEELLEEITRAGSIFAYNHYVGWIRGGAYYFIENPLLMDEVRITITKKHAEKKGEEVINDG